MYIVHYHLFQIDEMPFFYCVIIIIIIVAVSLISDVKTMPRLAESNGATKYAELNSQKLLADHQPSAECEDDNFNVYFINGAHCHFLYQSKNDHSPPPPPSTFIEQIGRVELVQSMLQRFMQRIGGGVGENSNQQQRIERQSPPTIRRNVEKKHREIFGRMRNFDSPMSAIVRSPSLGRTASSSSSAAAVTAKDPPQISSSISARPMRIAKEQQFEQRTADEHHQLTHGMDHLHDAIGKEWRHALFGRGGLLTEIFNFVNDKRKEGLAKQQAVPNLNGDKASSEFSRIVDALLRKAKSGNFDEEPLPELPFIGICNRLSCADIYKALDQFRKSEFFSNFQTAISLLQDPKGLDMIGELLANPDLIENFSGPDSLGELFGTKKAPKNGGTRHIEIGENTDDENIGIDFSALIDGPNNNTTKNVQMPDIVASSNGMAVPDYYNSFVGQKSDRAEKLDRMPKDKMPHQQKGESIRSAQTTIDFTRGLPEIAESIDGGAPEEEEDFPGGDDMLAFEKSEWLPSASTNGTTSNFVLTPIADRRLQDKKSRPKPVESIVRLLHSKRKDGQQSGGTTRNNATKMGKDGASAAGPQTSDGTIRSGVKPTTPTPSSSSSTTTTTIRTMTTRRNFRRDDDYYSMYYDGGENG